MTHPILHISKLSVTIHGQSILKNISFDANEHETIAIIGPNGAGKTTLFHALLGLIPFEGAIIWRPYVKIGYVPQRFSVEGDLPLTIEEFFLLKEQNKEEIKRVLTAVRLYPTGNSAIQQKFLHKKLGKLSGGELQKVLIAWAIMGHPDILLFDEPTSNVDITSEETLYSLIHKLQKEENMTVILISHELQIVYKYATNVVCLNNRSICIGPPKDVMDKKNLELLFGEDIGFYQHHGVDIV